MGVSTSVMAILIPRIALFAPVAILRHAVLGLQGPGLLLTSFRSDLSCTGVSCLTFWYMMANASCTAQPQHGRICAFSFYRFAALARLT